MIATGEWIKKARKACGLTAAELAVKTGVSLNHINRIEQGSRIPSADLMERIEEALRVNRASVSFDSEDLMQEIEGDIAEFGGDELCWLVYRPIGNYICFTDYQLAVPEMPLRQEEHEDGERAFMTTLSEAREWLKRQDAVI